MNTSGQCRQANLTGVGFQAAHAWFCRCFAECVRRTSGAFCTSLDAVLRTYGGTSGSDVADAAFATSDCALAESRSDNRESPGVRPVMTQRCQRLTLELAIINLGGMTQFAGYTTEESRTL